METGFSEIGTTDNEMAGIRMCNGLMDHLCPCLNGKGPIWARGNGKFNGTVDALMKISKNEGILSLWSGLSPTLVLAVPATIVYFVSYEQLRLYLKDKYNNNYRKVSGVTMEQPFWIPNVSWGYSSGFGLQP